MSRLSKILHVVNYYAPHTSGLTEYARLLAESLAALGHEVTVLTARHLADLAPSEDLHGVRVERAEPLLKLHKGIISAHFIRRYRRLVHEAAVVHLHLPMLESGLLARLTPKSVPLVVTYQCDLAYARSWSAVDRLAIAAVRASCRACCRRADRILVTSRDYASASPVIGGLRDKWVEVHPPDNAPAGLTPRPQDAGGPQRIGFLGRFVEEKGIDVILEAIPQVIGRHPAAHFILAGDYSSIPGGSQVERLQPQIRRLAANLEIPGKLPAGRLFEFYRSLDLFLLPSTNAYEAFGIVQIEAMKAGVPVIASDLRGVRVPVELTGCGTIVPAGDAGALAAAINDWLSGKKRLAPQEVAARAWRTFSNSAMVETVRDVYTAVCDASERQNQHQGTKRG